MNGWAGADGRTCGQCRYYYSGAMECRCNPPQVVVLDNRLHCAFPARRSDDIACGEWTVARTQDQAGERAAIASQRSR